jgi:hypothetical protein
MDTSSYKGYGTHGSLGFPLDDAVYRSIAGKFLKRKVNSGHRRLLSLGAAPN